LQFNLFLFFLVRQYHTLTLENLTPRLRVASSSVKKEKENEKEKKMIYPNHVAFIMDGNGRWAKKLNRERLYGHTMGTVHMIEIINDAFRNGSNFLTFFVFSEQNWKRPQDEIDNIFENIYTKLKVISEELDIHKFRILVQGRTDRVPKKLRTLLKIIQNKSKHFHKTVVIAIDYSGRKEIIQTCQKIIEKKEPCTIESFKQRLHKYEIPDPDLIIRTGGERRISDFLLWQICNSELYFTDVLWPDFTLSEFHKAIADYSKLERRFGNVFASNEHNQT
jgi:undecaprenyl diphosphate synthase